MKTENKSCIQKDTVEVLRVSARLKIEIRQKGDNIMREFRLCA
jgi:hypothetical protein